MSDKKSLKVKLIHCGNINIANPQADKEQKNIFFMPMGLIGLANYARSKGFDIEILHMDILYNNEIQGEKSIYDALDIGNVDAIGMDCHWANQSLVVIETAAFIKKLRPDVFVFLGGFTASLFSEEIIEKYKQIDAVVRGDGEIPFVELLMELENRKHGRTSNLKNVQNLVYREADCNIAINNFSYVATQREVDFLDYADISVIRYWEIYRDLSKYYSNFKPTNEEPMFLLEAARGCPYSCTFCGGNCVAQVKMNNRTGPIVRKAESVEDTIRKAYAMGYRTLYTCMEFEGCDEFYVSVFDRIKDISGEMNYAYGSWSLPTRKLMDSLSESFKHVVIEISPETSNHDLRLLNKDKRLFYTNDQLEDFLDYIKSKKNMKSQLFFGYFVANDTYETICSTMEYILRLLVKYPGMIEIEYANFSTDPGSLFFFDPEKYKIDIKVKCFSDYLNCLEENYVKSKGRDADMTVFKPSYLSEEEAFEIDRKVKRFNFTFSRFRKAVTHLLYMKDGVKLMMKYVETSSTDVDFGSEGAIDIVKDDITSFIEREGINSHELIRLVNMEYKKYKEKYHVSKPTTQLYLEFEDDELLDKLSLNRQGLNNPPVILEEDDFCFS